MVNFKSAITLGLMVSTVSAALKNDKRHVHHRRAKAPCTTSTIASVPYPVGNSTQPAGTGAVSTATTADTSSSEAVITYTVVPVPVNPTSSVGSSETTAQASSGNSGPSTSTSVAAGVPSPSGGSGAPSAPAGNGGSACGVATSYVTVQQTITVTAGQVPETTPSTSAAPVTTSSTSTSTTVVKTTAIPSPAAFQQIGGSGHAPAPVFVEPHTSTSAAPVAASSPAQSSPPKSSAPKSSGGAATCSGGGKAGIAWASWIGEERVPFSSLGSVNGACWAYDWSDGNTAAPGIEYVPSLQKPAFASGFGAKVQGQSGVTHIKSLNEPDMLEGQGGCSQSPSQAAAIHKDVLAPLQGQYHVGMPSVSSNDVSYYAATQQPAGLKWLEAFVGEAGCNFAFADAHWYGGAGQSVSDQVKYFTTYVETFKTRLDTMCPGSNLPIWFTELGTGNPGDIDAFMAAVAPILDQDSRVGRYSAWNGQNSAISSVLSSILAAI